jgi:hypothetical protein
MPAVPANDPGVWPHSARLPARQSVHCTRVRRPRGCLSRDIHACRLLSPQCCDGERDPARRHDHLTGRQAEVPRLGAMYPMALLHCGKISDTKTLGRADI